MKKVHSGRNTDKTLDELYKRYENRSSSYDRSREYAEQKSREITTRSTAPKSYKISNGEGLDIKQFKSGVEGGRRYMTEGDFAKYYKATREYTPQTNVELDTMILLQKIDRARYKQDGVPSKKKSDVKKKLKAEAMRSSANVPPPQPTLKKKISKAK